MFDELDRGLNHLVNEVLQHDAERHALAPVTVSELDDRYVVQCDVPGVSLEDIAVTLNDGLLQISGERKSDISDDTSVTVNERPFDTFQRKLQLSRDVNPDSVDAELGNGVLTVTVLKSDKVLPRSIRIRPAEKS